MQSATMCRRLIRSLVAALALFVASTATADPVGLYRVFETEVINTNDYKNRFVDVELLVENTAPSGKQWDFWGVFDGDGKGGGDKSTGDVWKLRFMPDAPGTWTYAWRWSDDTEGGEGRFEVTEENAGKGVIKAYAENPHGFAYNGTEPVWLKYYNETGHGSIAQDFDWVTENVFEPLVEHGYNHLQVNWLMSLCCYGQYYYDGPEPSTLELDLYEGGSRRRPSHCGAKPTRPLATPIKEQHDDTLAWTEGAADWRRLDADRVDGSGRKSRAAALQPAQPDD